MRLDKAHRILDGDDLFGRVIGDLAAEFFLKRHDEFDGVKAVSAEIIDKAGIFRSPWPRRRQDALQRSFLRVQQCHS